MTTDIVDVRERLARLETEVAQITVTLVEVRRELGSLVNAANRWRGGFVVVLGIGMLLGSALGAVAERIAFWK